MVLGARVGRKAYGEHARDWRRWLVRALGVALALKLVALLVIKSAFFSAAREPDVTPRLVDRQLAVEPRASSAHDQEAPR
jgi:hypothetical protein